MKPIGTKDVVGVFRALVASLVANFVVIFALTVLAGSFSENLFRSAFDNLTGFFFLSLFGLVALAMLEVVGRNYKRVGFLDRDWTLISFWEKCWQDRNYFIAVPLTVALMWWWLAAGYLLCVAPLFLGAGWFCLMIGLLPVLSVIMTVLGWGVDIVKTAISRFFIIVPYFASKEDAEAAKKAVQGALKSLQERFKGKQSNGTDVN